MSFDLFVFERREDIRTSEDVIRFLEIFTKYSENKDYNSLLGCSDIISAWSRKMFEKFPPLNGKHTLPNKLAFVEENYLADYSFGKYGVYCSFSPSVAEEALNYIISILDEYNIGMYNLQNYGAIYGKDIEILKYRTESTEDMFSDWNNIQMSVQTIDSIERGTSHRNNAFITVWFEKNGKSEKNYIQCTPNYEKKGFMKNIFNKRNKNIIKGYLFEIMKEDELYQIEVENKNNLTKLMKSWCVNRKEPDISSYKKIL